MQLMYYLTHLWQILPRDLRENLQNEPRQAQLLEVQVLNVWYCICCITSACLTFINTLNSFLVDDSALVHLCCRILKLQHFFHRWLIYFAYRWYWIWGADLKHDFLANLVVNIWGVLRWNDYIGCLFHFYFWYNFILVIYVAYWHYKLQH